MASEIKVDLGITAYKSTIMTAEITRAIRNLTINMTADNFSEGVMSVATSATAVPLGQVTSLGWCFFANKDTANFLKIRNGSGGADVVKLLAGECCLFPFLNTGVPYAIADTAACLMEYLILGR